MTLKTVFRWHLWLGLFSALFMFLIGMTGACAVFMEEIDWLATPALRAQSPADAERATPAAVIAAVQKAYPDSRITSLEISSRPSFCHIATVTVKPRGSMQVFVDPGTAEITGTRKVSGGYTSTVRTFIRQSHVRLLMGLWGRVFVGLMGVTLVLSCITGLWIYRGWIKKMFRLHLTGGWRKRPAWAELHKFVGVWSLLFNVVIGLTGAVLGLENLANQIESHWLQPKGAAAAKVAAAKAAAATRPTLAVGEPLTLTQLLARAHEVFPDLAVRTIDLPARPNAPATLRGDVPSVLMMQSHVRRASSLALDPVSGEVINLVDGRDATGLKRLYFTVDPLHFGYFGGMVTKVIWFILGLTPGALALTGSVMWWRRRSRASAPTPAPSAATPPAPASRAVVGAIVVLSLAAGYWVVGRSLGNSAFTLKLAEHWLVKPLALAIAAFPITGLIAWLIDRLRARRALHYTAWAALGVWFVFLSSLFRP